MTVQARQVATQEGPLKTIWSLEAYVALSLIDLPRTESQITLNSPEEPVQDVFKFPGQEGISQHWQDICKTKGNVVYNVSVQQIL